jgi:hypothetical protein
MQLFDNFQREILGIQAAPIEDEHFQIAFDSLELIESPLDCVKRFALPPV